MMVKTGPPKNHHRIIVTVIVLQLATSSMYTIVRGVSNDLSSAQQFAVDPRD